MPTAFSALSLLSPGVMPVAGAAGDSLSLAERDAAVAAAAQAAAQSLKLDSARLKLAPEKIRRSGPWLLLTGHLRKPDGQRFDYAGTELHAAAQAGALSDLCVALLQREGQGWKLVDIAVGATDVQWENWAATHKAPADLFKAAP